MKKVFIIMSGCIGDGSEVFRVYQTRELAEQKLKEIDDDHRKHYKSHWDKEDQYDPFYKNDFEYYYNQRLNRGATVYSIEEHFLFEGLNEEA